MSKLLIVIVGPTASGKTARAIELAKSFDTEIVSCDSRQIFRELSIGVARPSLSELETVKHHLIACHSVQENYNVSRFEQESLSAVSNIFQTHDVAVAVGGSNLYVDALCKGIAPMPDTPSELREELKTMINDKGLQYAIDRLKELDSNVINQLDLRNPVRVQRALEVCILTGKPYSDTVRPQAAERPFKIKKIALQVDRTILKSRIASRVQSMMKDGLEDEARSVFTLRHLQPLNTVGYKEMFDFFDGKCSLEEAVSAIGTHTWQYAKKQLTWLKRDSDLCWLPFDRPINLETVLAD